MPPSTNVARTMTAVAFDTPKLARRPGRPRGEIAPPPRPRPEAYSPPDQTDHWPAQEFGDKPLPAAG